MSYVDNDYQQSSKYIENLSNEYKGNLFEYLVAEELARTFHLESYFYPAIPVSYRQVLQSYSQNLQKINGSILTALPSLAKIVAATISTSLKTTKFKNILLIGKVENSYNEADLLLVTEKGEQLPLSLKLCKANSYINTKSGGVKSFFAKYFSAFSEAELIQLLFEKKIISEFETMVTAFKQELSLSSDIPTLKLKEALIAKGISLLPGELPEVLQSKVLHYYYAINAFILDKMYELYTKDRTKFLAALFPLWGMSRQSLYQVFVLHESYRLSSIKIQQQAELAENLDKLVFHKEAKVEKSFFEMETPNFIFQVRVKPMNEYLVPSLKINCSLKVRCDK